jgi:thiamine-phosphate pyrophosphorylase
MPEKEPYVIQRLPTQLYLISPLDVGGSFPDRLARALDAGPVAAFQFRVKGLDEHEAARLAEPLQRLCNDREVAFIVNDSISLAKHLGADGVHLGQGDRGEDHARRRGLLLGRSATTYEEALATDADYLGVGPVWDTPSKADAAPALGLDELARICRAVRVPVIAIGGIDASNAAACIRAGAAGVAVIRAATDPAVREAVDEAFRAR